MTDPGQGKQLILLTRVETEPIAQMWADVLRQEGINCLLRSEGAGFGSFATGALLDYSIWVLASDADRAREVVAALREELDQDLEQTDEDRDGSGARFSPESPRSTRDPS